MALSNPQVLAINELYKRLEADSTQFNDKQKLAIRELYKRTTVTSNKSIPEQEPKGKEIGLGERFGRKVLSGLKDSSVDILSKFVGMAIAKDPTDFVNMMDKNLKAKEEDKWMDVPKAHHWSEHVSDFVSDVIGSTPELVIAGGGAKVLTKNVGKAILTNKTAARKIASKLTERGARGALFSMIYDISEENKISPTRAAVFAGLDIGLGAVGDKVGKAVTKFRDKKAMLKGREELQKAAEQFENMEAWREVSKQLGRDEVKAFGKDMKSALPNTPEGQQARELIDWAIEVNTTTEGVEKTLANLVKAHPEMKEAGKVAIQAMKEAQKLTPEMSKIQKQIFGAANKKGLSALDVKRLGEDVGIDRLKFNTGGITQEQGIALLEKIKNVPDGLKGEYIRIAREFKNPGLGHYITPGDRYGQVMGVYDIIEPGIKAKREMERQINVIISKVVVPSREQWHKATKGVIKGNRKVRDKHLWELLNKHETAKEAGLTGEMAESFTTLRKLTNGMMERANEIRTDVGLEPITKLDGYITHLFDVAKMRELRKKYPLPTVLEMKLNKVSPTHIFNPTAIQRKGLEEGLLKDPWKALEFMTRVDAKTIYMSKPNILFRESMDKLINSGEIPAGTAEWTQAFWNNVILGYPSRMDKMTSESLRKLKPTQVLELIDKIPGMQDTFSRKFTSVIRRLAHSGAMWGRPMLAIRNHTQKFLHLGMYGHKSWAKGFTKTTPELERLIVGSDFFQASRRKFVEAQAEGAVSKLEKAGYSLFGRSHVSNVRHAMKTAYHSGKELVTNPKYKKLGWTMDDVVKEMEYGANTSQYLYDMIGMPGIFRSELGKTFFTLQSWWMNYTAKYWRELLHRAFKGETGWGKPVPLKWRMGALRHVVTWATYFGGLGTAIGLGYDKMALLGAIPNRLSPTGQILKSLLGWATADSRYETQKARYDLENALEILIPGRGLARDITRAVEKGDPTEALFHKKRDKQEQDGGLLR